MQSESNNPSSSTDGQGVSSAPAVIGKVDGAKSAAQMELSNFLADVEDLINATTSLTGEDLALARAKLAERVAKARQSLEAMRGAIIYHARKTAADTNDFVHEQPWKSVGLGVALGAIMGFMLARRK